MIQIIIYAILFVGFVFFFRKAGRDKSKWGINFKRVYCPVCQTRQPIIRWPESMEQAAWGGTTCSKCHTKLDKYGGVIS